MVSIGNSGYNPYLPQYGNKKAGKGAKANGADAVNSHRAPQIPNFPDKKTTSVKGYTVSGTITPCVCGLSSKSEAIDYANSHAKQQVLEVVELELRKGVVHGDGWEAIPNDWEDRCNNSSVVISNEQIEVDITSVKITENDDGTFNISYTVNYNVTCDYELTTDWQPGDQYTDENGYVWEYQEDGSWKDTGTREAHPKGDSHSTTDNKHEKLDKYDKYEMSTAEFLQIRDSGKKFKI